MQHQRTDCREIITEMVRSRGNRGRGRAGQGRGRGRVGRGRGGRRGHGVVTSRQPAFRENSREDYTFVWNSSLIPYSGIFTNKYYK